GVKGGEIVVSASYEDFDDLWEPFLAGVGPGGDFTASLAPEAQAALREEYRRRLRLPEGPFELQARAWYAVGTRYRAFWSSAAKAGASDRRRPLRAFGARFWASARTACSRTPSGASSSWARRATTSVSHSTWSTTGARCERQSSASSPRFGTRRPTSALSSRPTCRSSPPSSSSAWPTRSWATTWPRRRPGRFPARTGS